MTPPDPMPEDLELQLERLHEASYGWALSCCGWNAADAEDVLQTTYLKVISGRARYGGRSTFKTWLFGVIRRTASEHARSSRSEWARAERFGLETPAASWDPRASDEAAESVETGARLLAALAELPPKQREVLHLVFYQDLSIREAADVMKVSVGTARVHYDRGKKRLRTLLFRSSEGGEAN